MLVLHPHLHLHRHHPHHYHLPPDMLEGPIPRRMLSFALPIAASGMLQQLFNSTDVAVVGQFAGHAALAAVGACSPVINLLINLFVGLSIGSNVVIAHLLGEGNDHGVRRAVHTSLLLALLSGIFLAGFGQVVAYPLLAALSTPDDVLPKAVLYLRVYFAGMPFLMLYNFAAAILRSKGDTRRPLHTLFISGLINVSLNLFFVLGLGWGVEGVAMATVIATAFSSYRLISFLRQEEGVLRVRLHQLRIDRHQLRKIALIGIPAGLQSCLFSFSNIMIQQSINSLGTIAVAAATAAMNFEYYLYFIANSLSQTATTWIGQNYGAGRLDRCRTIARWSLIWGVSCTLLVSLVLVGFSRPLLHIFTANAAVVAMAQIRIWVISSTECLNAVVEAFTGILRAYGYSLVPTLISLLGIVGLRLTWIGTVFQMYPDFGVLSACYPISWIVTSIALYIAYRWVQRPTGRPNKSFV